jgi:hypothetical protein
VVSAPLFGIANLNCPLKAPLALHLHGSTLIHIRGTTNRLVFRLCRCHIEQREWIQETKDRSWCRRDKPDTDEEATNDTTTQSYGFRSARKISVRYDLQHLQTGALLIGKPTSCLGPAEARQKVVTAGVSKTRTTTSIPTPISAIKLPYSSSSRVPADMVKTMFFEFVYFPSNVFLGSYHNHLLVASARGSLRLAGRRRCGALGEEHCWHVRSTNATDCIS